MTTPTKTSDEARAADPVLPLTAHIVMAFVRHNSVPVTDVPALLKSVYAVLRSLLNSIAPDSADAPKPAVPIRKSIASDHIVCLEDGKKLKMLKRYLRARFQLSPEEYRARWGLPLDYPMVAPSYAAQRSAFAKRIGLGRKPHQPKQRRRSA